MPTLLFRDTFAEDANLVDHLPSTSTPWFYDDDPDAYTCHAAVGLPTPFPAYLDGAIAAATAPAANAYVLPVGIKRWRVVRDIYRGGVDWPGGGFITYGLCPPAAMAPGWTPTNVLAFGIRRADAGQVQFACDYARPLIPAGPQFVTLRSKSIEHLGETWRRYIWEVDELAGRVDLFLADAFTGANQVAVADPVGDGLFTAELTAHVADDTTERLLGHQGGWSASGQTYFASGVLEIYELEIPTIGAPCTFLLTTYDNDGVTTLWEVATDPDHPYPILCEPESLNEQELDIAKGAATVGSVRVSIADRPITVGDQDSGQFTGWLASLGLNAIGGRRMRLVRFGPTGDPIVIMDGPASNANLDADYASFSCEIRDTRDTERKLRLFDAIGVVADEISGVSPTAPEIRGTQSEILWNTENH